MITLYLDTSSSFLYCGIVEDNYLAGEIKENLGKELSSFAMVKIEQLFKRCKLEPKDIDRIVVVNGPGSFTGVRIGITIAKTLAWTLNKKISTISSLYAMAISSNGADYFVPMIDARRNYVYGAIFDKDGIVILKEQYLSLEALKQAVANLPGTYKYVTNDNIEIEKITYVPDILKIVNLTKDIECINPHSIDALYLKETEAEEHLND